MNKPLVSVIIPCYNASKYLRKCLDSVLNGKLKDIELIAIDDGSSDNTSNILKEYQEKDKRVKAFYQKNSGQAKTRNKAIKKANGIYLFFLDSDDYIDNDLLYKLYTKASEGYDIVISGAKRVRDGAITNIDTFKIYSKDNIKNYILNSSGPAWKLVKKDIIIDNKLYFYENHIYEDIAIVPVWGVYANKVGYVGDTNYYYLIHDGSTMNQTKYNAKLEDIFYSLDYLTSMFKDNYHDELEYIYIEHLLRSASLRFYYFKHYDMIDKIVDIMKIRYPKWYKNEYYRQENIKYKIVCQMFYHRKYHLLKFILKSR